MWTVAKAFFQNPWVEASFGALLLVLGWKLTGKLANFILVLAWLTLIPPFFQVVRVPGLGWRVASTTAFAVASGALIYAFLWTSSGLTNAELRERAFEMVRKIDSLTEIWGQRVAAVKQRAAQENLSSTAAVELEMAEMRRASEEYERELSVDAGMLRRELRSRVPYEKRKHIVGLPDMLPANPNAGAVSFYDVMGAPFSLAWAGLLARELQQLAKLLPD